MLVSLTEYTKAGSISVDTVGGKAASLHKLASICPSHVPPSHALSVDFFRPWMEQLKAKIIQNAQKEVNESNCRALQQTCLTEELSLNSCQKDAIQTLQTKILPSFRNQLAAVRSSAPEEDSAEASLAGVFVTKLGVSSETLEAAVKECFASRFDYHRVAQQQQHNNRQASSLKDLLDASNFAVVVMEMVDSTTAGVAFTANPLNSDRDELVMDASYGLGESVVDGSVTADRYIYDKVQSTILDQKLGKKTTEKKLKQDGGGVKDIAILDETRQIASSLSAAQVHELAQLACRVEEFYGRPMDIEWAFVQSPDQHKIQQLKLLQARPITTLFTLDSVMMTQPGDRRMLYYDYNIVADATTTTPFTHMDMNFYGWASSAMMGFDHDIFSQDPNMPIFKASTRQYMNWSLVLKFVPPDYNADTAQLLDPYLASICTSKDCCREKYRMKKLPKGVGLGGLWRLLRQFPLMKLYKIGKECRKDPLKAKQRYKELVQRDKAKLQELQQRGPNPDEGFHAFAIELFQAMSSSFEFELGALFFVILEVFKDLDKHRREGKTAEIREQYSALCGGYEGDGLMQMNIDLYHLARLLPKSVWDQYPHDKLEQLATRIESNLNDSSHRDLPQVFLDEWKSFVDQHGWDGQDQLFPSCPRYEDSPVLLLAKMLQNAGDNVTNPEEIYHEKIRRRREVMALHEEEARSKGCLFSSLKKIQNRNTALEHLMCIRNNPKLHLCQLCGILRSHILKTEQQLVQQGRLEQTGDIFHIDLSEVDQALKDTSMDLMSLVRPRKVVHETAKKAKECPLLVDSRCRILRPDPPEIDHEDGTLVGAALSPGIVRGKVRIISNPFDNFESGDVLAAVVTGPAWTPLFAGASGIILQIGGVLQHGALTAREYGKPAVSNIVIHSNLKTGMRVEVDGNAGIVKILDS